MGLGDAPPIMHEDKSFSCRFCRDRPVPADWSDAPSDPGAHGRGWVPSPPCVGAVANTGLGGIVRGLGGQRGGALGRNRAGWAGQGSNAHVEERKKGRRAAAPRRSRSRHPASRDVLDLSRRAMRPVVHKYKNSAGPQKARTAACTQCTVGELCMQTSGPHTDAH